MTTRVHYEQELEKLRQSLTNMSQSVEESIDKLFEAVDKMEDGIAEEITRQDRNVNDMERSIEAQCLSLITRQQPIAGDLRLVSSALKVVTDLERIGDHAVDIAELILRNREENFLSYSTHITPMIDASKQMLHDAIEAFSGRNIDLAQQVIEGDDVVDELFNKIKNDIIVLLRQNHQNPDTCIDLMMMAKYLEKIGDHAVTIAEWELFRETGIIQNVRLL
ncbi:MAG: phosphate signaling complex protein PhoU [Lachnospiraceae bacterium]